MVAVRLDDSVQNIGTDDYRRIRSPQVEECSFIGYEITEQVFSQAGMSHREAGVLEKEQEPKFDPSNKKAKLSGINISLTLLLEILKSKLRNRKQRCKLNSWWHWETNSKSLCEGRGDFSICLSYFLMFDSCKCAFGFAKKIQQLCSKKDRIWRMKYQALLVLSQRESSSVTLGAISETRYL